MKLVTFHIPVKDLNIINTQVNSKRYESRAAALRKAVADLIINEKYSKGAK